MKQLQDSLQAVKGAAADRAAKLLAELGTEAWAAGRTETGVGALDIYVTAEGLKRLTASTNANSFSAGKPWWARLPGAIDGRHKALADLIEARGSAEVVVTLASDEHDFEMNKDGTASVRTTPKLAAEAHIRANALLGTLSDAELTGGRGALLAAAARAPAAGTASFSSQITMRVNAQGLLKLVDSEHVRDVRPVGFKDKLGSSFDSAAFDEARKSGYANVILTLRSPFDSKMNTQAAFDANTVANLRNIDNVLRDFRISGKIHDLPEFASVIVRMSLQELNALKVSGDQRVLSVAHDKPMARPSLTTSTVSMNMATAWNVPQYRGTGQLVAILDTGVQSDHVLLSGLVAEERCFGTGATFGGVTYQSNCFASNGVPVPESAGPGSATPKQNCMANASVSASTLCAHGTHVASIVASKTVSLPGQGVLSGVAPGAKIVAIQLNSYDVLGQQPPTVFTSDTLKALQFVMTRTSASTLNNPWTVNISFGSGWNSTPCSPGAFAWSTDISVSITNAVQALYARGVPVIAATGNEGYRDGIAFPACIPSVIKVSSLVNNLEGTTLSQFPVQGGGNLVNPSWFAYETFWVAPGGGAATTALANTAANTTIPGAGFINTSTKNALANLNGTSMAAPHVSAIYAAVKGAVPGVSVDGIYQTLVNFAAVQNGPSFTANACPTGVMGPFQFPCVLQAVSYKKIRLP